MHLRRLTGCLTLALAASATYPVVTGSPPAAAHSGFTSIDDNGAADRTVTNINGTTVKVRVLRPSTTASKPANGWPLVVYMAGDLKNRCANVNETSTRPSWYTRKQMAADGFAVLSFNARGLPANYNAGDNPSSSTTSDCDASADAQDALDDSGWDVAGPNDKQDIDDLIEWAVASYSDPVGCPNPCIDGTQVGLFGAGMDARKALHMAVPAATNPQHNTRVKGVVAVGYEELTVRNLAALSSDGGAPAAFRDVDSGLWGYTPDMHVGYMSRSDPSVATNLMELARAKYLNESVGTTTTTWLDSRAIVDDDEVTTDGDARVDKAGLITSMPVFMANAFLDGDAGIATATLAYNKLATANKYLYLGPCGSSYAHLDTGTGPCLATTNAPNLRNKVHAFLDRHVRNDTTVTVGGPVHFAMPPATSPLSSDNWAVQTASAWPPPGSSSTYCVGTDGNWYAAATCAEPTGFRSISNVVSTTPQGDFCLGATYGPTEKTEYTSGVLPGKMVGLEVDFWLLSSSTRSQVYVDVFDVTPATTTTPESETRIWQGDAQIVPTARNVAAYTGVHYKFRPGGNAWTIPANHKIRIKVAANDKGSFAQELIPATYYIWHDDNADGTAPFKVTVTWAT